MSLKCLGLVCLHSPQADTESLEPCGRSPSWSLFCFSSGPSTLLVPRFSSVQASPGPLLKNPWVSSTCARRPRACCDLPDLEELHCTSLHILPLGVKSSVGHDFSFGTLKLAMVTQFLRHSQI